MAFPIDPGRPPGIIPPLENLVPNQGNVDPRAMLPLVPAREQQHHDVRQHAGLGHGQHDDQDMNLEDMLPLRQAFNLDQEDAMLEDDNDQLREQTQLREDSYPCDCWEHPEQKHGAKTLSSKMSPEGPFGQFRHLQCEILLFVFLGLLKRQKTRFARKWGTHPRSFS